MGFWDDAIDLLKSKPSRGERRAAKDATKRASIPGAAPQFVGSPGDGPLRSSFKKKFSAAQKASEKVKRSQSDAYMTGMGLPKKPTQAEIRKVKSTEAATDRQERRLKAAGIPHVRKDWDKVEVIPAKKKIKPYGWGVKRSWTDGEDMFGQPDPTKRNKFIDLLTGRNIGRGGVITAEDKAKELLEAKAAARNKVADAKRKRIEDVYKINRTNLNKFKPDDKTKKLISDWKSLPKNRKEAFIRELNSPPSERKKGFWSAQSHEIMQKFDNPNFIKFLRSKDKIMKPKRSWWAR